MYTAKVSTKGWVVIPKGLREKHGLKQGSRVQIVEYEDILILVPLPEDPAGNLSGRLAGEGSLTKELLDERAREREAEEKPGNEQ